MMWLREFILNEKKGAARSTVLCGDERAAPEWGMVRGSAFLTRGDVWLSVFGAPTVRCGGSSDPASCWVGYPVHE